MDNYVDLSVSPCSRPLLSPALITSNKGDTIELQRRVRMFKCCSIKCRGTDEYHRRISTIHRRLPFRLKTPK
ncbi:hypothetical protein J6590_054829 [Homalodisca vitripennis]|nr:hypothetical protein J6590_054829 [Homalodisca vitripennis]